MTKDTREAIAMLIGEAAYDAGATVFDTRAVADAILTALEPAQAGGDVRELCEKIAKSLREEIGIYTDYEFMPHTKEIERWLKPFLTATPAQPDWPDTKGKYPKALIFARYRANGMGEPDDEGSYIGFKMHIEGKDQSFNFGMSDDAYEHLRDTADPHLQSDTPAQPTPSGEVDGLVAEIEKCLHILELKEDGMGLDYPNANPTEIGCAKEDLADALVNAWPRVRTVLGGGWRDISEYDKTPDSLGLTKTVILGFAPDETGETLPSTAGYWRQEAWKGCEPCFVSCMDPDTPFKPAQPTHFMDYPEPPLTRKER